MAEGVTEDTLLGGQVHLAQPAGGYRVGIDPVFLAAAVPALPGQSVLEVGSGAGAASLCLAVRVDRAQVTGIEPDRALVSLAADNARATGVADRVRFFVGDLLQPPVRLAPASFDHVLANPPYLVEGSGRPSPDPAKARATVEAGAKLADWIAFCLRMVRNGGTVTLIHRGDRLADLLILVAGRLGDITLWPLWPGGDGIKAAKRIVLRGQKGSAAPLRLLPGIVLHDDQGRFTGAADAVLRHGAALPE
jgi:tRNA1(Val) A37 N6-methylase TrmN6